MNRLPVRCWLSLNDSCRLLSRETIARTALVDRGVILIARDLEEAIELANGIAIEHLELMIADPWAQLPHIRHAGAIFLGSNTPEAAGDYFAGPNHVLPTMGTAKFASALGVETFLKEELHHQLFRQRHLPPMESILCAWPNLKD